MTLQMRDLLYFAKVAELSHLGQASSELHISQPALSKCIDRLEVLYGAELFERSGRGIRLTDAGRVLQERVRLIKRTLDETQLELHSLGAGQSGLIKVGAAATVSEFLMPAACRILQNEAPGVVVDLQIGMNDVLHDALRKQVLDLVIGPIGARDDGFVQIPVCEDQVVVAASRAHPLAGKRVSLDAMCRHGWVLPADSVATRQWLERTFVTQGLPLPRAAITTSSFAAVPTLIAETGLLAFISRRTLDSGRFASELVELKNPITTMRRQFGIVHRSDGYLSPAARRLVEIIHCQGQVPPDSTRARTGRKPGRS